MWAEHDQAHTELRRLVAALPEELWNGHILFPWNGRGTARQLIRIMMRQESMDDCGVVRKATASGA